MTSSWYTTIKAVAAAVAIAISPCVAAKTVTTTVTTVTATASGDSTVTTTTTTTETTSREKFSFLPKVHGTFRGFYQWSTATGQSRFMVRNARLSLSGAVLPKLDYYMQVDFCDAGSIRLLDVYARVKPAEGAAVMLGQMRVPFCAAATRAPRDYYFTDVELTAVFGNLRSVGVKGSYTLPGCFPLYIEGGVFNATDRSNHNVWQSALTYGIKTNVRLGGFRPEIAFMSRVPGARDKAVRINMLNASLSWSCGGFFAEGEYIMRHYTGRSFDTSHAYSVFASWSWPVTLPMADALSAQLRFDGLSDASSGVLDADGRLSDDISGRRRLTLGATAHYTYRGVGAKFMLNFEQYFYNDHYSIDVSATDNSKLVAGLVVWF